MPTELTAGAIDVSATTADIAALRQSLSGWIEIRPGIWTPGKNALKLSPGDRAELYHKLRKLILDLEARDRAAAEAKHSEADPAS